MESFLLPTRSRAYSNGNEYIKIKFELLGRMARTNHGRLVLAALENPHHAFLLPGSTELVIQSVLAGCVENPLGSMADAGNGC